MSIDECGGVYRPAAARQDLAASHRQAAADDCGWVGDIRLYDEAERAEPLDARDIEAQQGRATLFNERVARFHPTAGGGRQAIEAEQSRLRNTGAPCDKVYDEIWRLRQSDGRVALEAVREHLLPGDRLDL